MKQTIDIENLLIWAYRDQCVDRQMASFTPRGPSSSVAGSLGQYVALGTRVDNSGFAARALGVRLPDDALVVHDSVLSLGDMWVEWVGAREVHIWDKATAAAAGQVIERMGGDWFRVPSYSSGPVAPLPVRLEQASTVALLIVNAKNGGRPECHAGWKAPEGRALSSDRSATDRWGRRRRTEEGPNIKEVMHARAMYRVWHAALALLAIDLADLLQEFHVIPPGAHPNPWTQIEKRVHIAIPLHNSEPVKSLKRKRNK